MADPRDADSAPSPVFQPGDRVEVVPGELHRTVHRGEVARSVWHFKHRCWFYFLVCDGRAVSTRYRAEDLRRAA